MYKRQTLNRGFEVQLKWNETLKNDFRYWANFNISFSRNKISNKAEYCLSVLLKEVEILPGMIGEEKEDE